jgi:hypothetical protein
VSTLRVVVLVVCTALAGCAHATTAPSSALRDNGSSGGMARGGGPPQRPAYPPPTEPGCAPRTTYGWDPACGFDTEP